MGEYFESTGAAPQLLIPLLGETALGRSVSGLKSKFVSVPVRMLNGRPDEKSKIGATVKLEKTAGTKPEPPMWPEL